MPLKILHAADFHIREKDIAECRKVLEFMVENAIEEKPDLIIIAGDIFDSRTVKLESLSARLGFQIVGNLLDIAPVAIIIGTPSHDGLCSEQFMNIARNHHQLNVYAHPGQFALGASPDADPIAVVSMVPTPTKQFFQSDADISGTNDEIATAMSALFAGFGAEASKYDCPHIMAGHFSVGGAFVSDTQTLLGVDIEMSRYQIEMANADLVCLGHIHYHQQIGDNIFYSGSTYRKDFGELENKGFYYHTVDKSGLVESRFVETPTRKLLKIEADFTQEGVDLNDLDTIMYQHGPDELKGSVVRVEFKIWQDEAEKLDKQNLIDFFEPTEATEIDVRIIRVPRETVRSERILKLRTLRDKVKENAEIKGEVVVETVLAKCDLLQAIPAETIINNAGMAN